MTSSKIKIGITLRVVNANNYSEKRDAISHDWTNFFEKMNFHPIHIPNTLLNPKEFLESSEVQGLILSGGDNIGDDPERDRTENEVIEYGIQKQIPILGVCRGMQVINNYFNGIISKNKNSSHVGNHHDVNVITEYFLSFFGKNSLNVNSFHNNIIYEQDLGDDLNSFAISPQDNTIEGFIHKKFPILGVMWHPEREQNDYNVNILKNLFEEKRFWVK